MMDDDDVDGMQRDERRRRRHLEAEVPFKTLTLVTPSNISLGEDFEKANRDRRQPHCQQ